MSDKLAVAKSTIFLIRGLPGSGKSTLAEKMVRDLGAIKHYEADMYFTNSRGEYLYDPTLIGDAHEWCMDMTAAAVKLGYDVVVSNTFTRLKEMKPYYQIAERVGAKVMVIECTENYGSVHGVPESMIKKMKDRWETLTD